MTRFSFSPPGRAAQRYVIIGRVRWRARARALNVSVSVSRGIATTNAEMQNENPRRDAAGTRCSIRYLSRENVAALTIGRECAFSFGIIEAIDVSISAYRAVNVDRRRALKALGAGANRLCIIHARARVLTTDISSERQSREISNAVIEKRMRAPF